MRAFITFKVGADAAQVHTRQYDMTDTEAELLKSEFLAYLNGGASALRGASYQYADPETGLARELVLSYDIVLFIEMVPPPPIVDAQNNLITGSLQSRLAGTGQTE